MKLLEYNKYRSTLFYKITIKDMERENVSGKRVVFFKSFKD